jgi:uncharacterized membrane protein YdcZ (DUF606 family)
MPRDKTKRQDSKVIKILIWSWIGGMGGVASVLLVLSRFNIFPQPATSITVISAGASLLLSVTISTVWWKSNKGNSSSDLDRHRVSFDD